MSENIPDFKLAIFDLRSGTALALGYRTVRLRSAEFHSAGPGILSCQIGLAHGADWKSAVPQSATPR